MEPENKIKLKKACKFNKNPRKSPKIQGNPHNFRVFPRKIKKNPLKIHENPANFEKGHRKYPWISPKTPDFFRNFPKKSTFFHFSRSIPGDFF